MKALSTILFVSTLFALEAVGYAQQSPLGQTKGPQDMLPDPNRPGQKAKAPAVKYALIMPDDKTAERVKDSERNPFGRSDDERKGITVKASNEENVIREQLLKLRVVGASPDSNGMRVMLGDMILASNQIVPTVLPEQTLFLKVGNISPNAIELVWVEKKASGLPPRKLVIPMDLAPKVRYKLQGQSNSDALAKKPRGLPSNDNKMGNQVHPGLTQVAKEKSDKVTSDAASDQAAKSSNVVQEKASTSTPGATSPPPANAPAPADPAKPSGANPEALAPLKKAFELFNTLTKPVSDRQ